MPVSDPQSEEVYTIRTFKSFEGYRWANSYEVQCVDSAATYADLVNAAMAIASRERILIYNPMRIYKVTISTYQPDSRPYDPSSFTTVNVDMRGEGTLSTDTLPLNVCVFVRRNTLVGRSGKAFYRGVLQEQHVTWGGDRFEIVPTRISEISTIVNQMLANIRPLFQMVLARGTPVPTNVRQVIGMTVVNRTSFKKLDNRYFDVRDR